MPCRFPLPPRRVSRSDRLAVSVLGALLPLGAAAAPDRVQFNPAFLQGEQAGLLDLARFESGQILPGVYSVDVVLNGARVARRDMEVRARDDGGSALCLSPAIIQILGVDESRVLAEADGGDEEQVRRRALPTSTFCDDIGTFIPSATTHFDAGEQQLLVSIPQAFLARDPRGWVDPGFWDDGITAALLAYGINYQRFQIEGQSFQATGVTLNGGVNVGAWRLRHDGYFNAGDGGHASYRASRSYAQRSFGAQGLQLTLGDAATRGDLFEAVSYRGISLASDPRMLPDSQRGYAPVVRGVARSNARVTVRQRDQVIHQANVAPGPFVIADLYGTAYAGDLDVEVLESDGSIQRFVVPFAAVPELLRVGQQRIELTGGVIRDAWLARAPGFLQTTVRRGLGNQFTGYVGATGGEDYANLVLGGAINTAAGAFSGDVTVSRANMPGSRGTFPGRMQGQSWRLNFSRTIASTDTTIALAAYRYSTDGFLSLGDAARLRQDLSVGLDGSAVRRQRSRLDLTVNQRLGARGGSLFLSGSTSDYWADERRQTNFGLGYSNMIGIASISVAAQRSFERRPGETQARLGNSLNLNVSVPLGRSALPARASASMSQRSDGRGDFRVGVNGTFGPERLGNYSVSGSRYGGQPGRVDAGIGVQVPVASMSAGIGMGGGTRSLSVGVSGGMVVHADGVAFSQQLGDTVGLLHVPGAANARVTSSVGIRTNRRGYALLPYLMPFRRNEITVDPKGLPLDVELESASVVATPSIGAVVKAVIAASTARSALIEVTTPDGRPLPFGLDVLNETGDVVGVVGQASRLWVRGIEPSGRLSVRTGTQGDERCFIDYQLDEDTDSDGDTGLIAAHCVGPR